MRRRAGLAVAALVCVVAACSDAPSSNSDSAGRDSSAHGDDHGGDGHGGDGQPPDGWNTPLGQPDQVIVGPQGAVPQFVATCGFSHMSADDPIVYPGAPGAAHTHVFFGNETTDAASTPATLADGPTTCEDQPNDHAAYWSPTLVRDGDPIEATKLVAYYRPGIGVDPTSVVAYPPGLMMIAGNPRAREPQPLEVVSWGCGTGARRAAAPIECPVRDPLHLWVTFPDCWDGVRLDSADHVGHVAYSSAGECPSTHPVSIPQLQVAVEFPVSGDVDGLVLSSGGLYSGHADFVNAWDPDVLDDLVRVCLHRQVVCGVSDS